MALDPLLNGLRIQPSFVVITLPRRDRRLSKSSRQAHLDRRQLRIRERPADLAKNPSVLPDTDAATRSPNPRQPRPNATTRPGEFP